MTRSVQKAVITALFAAIICLATFLFKLPIGSGGGYVHIGDAFIYLAATILPAPYAMAAGAIGAGLADIMGGYAAYVLPTAIIKALAVLPFTNAGRMVCTRNVIALLIAALIGLGGYFVTDWLLYGSAWTAFMAAVMGVTQPVASAAVFLVLAAAFDRGNIKKNFRWEK